MKYLALSIILLALSGCAASSVRYTSEELKAFSPDVQQKIIKGEISNGMTPQEVRYTWHAPKGVHTSKTKDNKIAEQWNYSNMGACPITLFFYEGKLSSIVLSDSGNSSDIRYTQEEIKGYPEDIKQLIINGQLSTGMTPQQVRNSWGSPDGVSSYAGADGKSREEWVYSSSALCRVTLVFSEGKLSGIVRSEGFGR
jgi:hypothetical protein